MPSVTLPVPAPVPEFLAPRVNSVRDAARAGQPASALARARLISTELADSYGPLHPYALHALELVAYCAQLAGQPATATETAVQAAAGWQRILPAGHRQILRQARNAAASWLTVSDATEAVRTGTALLALMPSVFGPGHPSGAFVERRLTAITGSDRHEAAKALRATGPALLVRP
ncbi:hypothetical protein ACWD48_12210 [Streptomyces sp. NPDC002519]